MRPTVREETGAVFMLRCAELGLSREDLDEMTMGMVYDLLIEKANDAEKYDLFLCMDDSNLRGAGRILGAGGAQKCRKLLSFAGSDADVSDPWYTRDFEAAYRDICRGCKGLLEKF